MKNEIRVEAGVIVMRVLHKNNNVFDVKCDISDMEILQKHYWVMCKNGTSVVCNYRKNGKMVKPTLHKILTGSRYVEFLNNDKLDFRRSNLQPIEKRVVPRQCGVSLKGNPFFVHDEGVTFFITDRKGKKTGASFIIDHEDFDLVSQYTWGINTVSGYVQTKTRGGRENSKGLYLHRLIMNANPGEEIDHKSRQKTNNRRYNLRNCTRSQNCHNSSIYCNNKTGKTGVSLTKNGKWRVQMQVKENRLDETFPTFTEAVAQRKQWEEELNPSGLSNEP